MRSLEINRPVRHLKALKGKGIYAHAHVMSKSAKPQETIEYRLRVVNCLDIKQAVTFSFEKTGYEVLSPYITEKELILEPFEEKECSMKVVMSERIVEGGFEKHRLNVIPNGDGAQGQTLEFYSVRYLPHPYITNTEKGWDEVKEKAKNYEWAGKLADMYIQRAEEWEVPEAGCVNNGMFETVNAHKCYNSAIAWKLTGRREFAGGIYWGRFLYNDIYEFLTPCEIVGSIAASGASGYTSYGMCGLDDGGVLHRMSDGFNESLSVVNSWFKRVVPMIRGSHKSPVAILFPSAMSAYEPMGVEGNKERRYDFLGWYKMCCDGGFGCDIIDMGMIEKGALKRYSALIIPENDCYFLDDNSAAEEKVREWTKNGGIVIHSPMDKLAENCFGICAAPHDGGAFCYHEKGLSQSDVFCAYEGEKIAEYLSDGAGAVVKNSFGKGAVYSFGFAYGYSYAAKIAPHVPLSEKNNELYPVPLMKRNILHDILSSCGIESCVIKGKDIETAEFDNCMIIVNHSSHPVKIDIEGEKLFEYEVDGSLLLPRSSVAVMR